MLKTKYLQKCSGFGWLSHRRGRVPVLGTGEGRHADPGRQHPCWSDRPCSHYLVLRSLVSPLLAAAVLQGFIRLLSWCHKINYLDATFSNYCILAGRQFGKKKSPGTKALSEQTEEKTTVSLAQVQPLSPGTLSGQGLPFSTALPSLPMESSLPALALWWRKAPLAPFGQLSFGPESLPFPECSCWSTRQGPPWASPWTAQAGRAPPRQPPV